MSAFVIVRHSVVVGMAAALLAGCGESQSPLSPPAERLTTRAEPNEQYAILHEFGVSPGDGTHPSAELIDVKGTFYGTTPYGGAYGDGTVFSITKSGQETVLHSFRGPDGAAPMAKLLNVDGTLYGTTSSGGANGSGTVFSITRSGRERVLHNFDYAYSYSRNGGTMPLAGLVYVNGTFYGTTYYGGAHACNSSYFCGTVFSLTMSGKYKVLHDFGATTYDGENPEAPLLDVGDTLYGTTSDGGRNNLGTVFSITTAGKYHKLYSFGTNPHDGGNPTAALIIVQGTLYGTASGGLAGGAVFSMTTDGLEKTLHNFGGSDGSRPLGGLVDVKGLLYGTTAVGGVYNAGTIFSVTTSGEEQVLHSFHAPGGKDPHAGLLAVGDTLYGTTYGGLKESHGNAFSLAL